MEIFDFEPQNSSRVDKPNNHFGIKIPKGWTIILRQREYKSLLPTIK